MDRFRYFNEKVELYPFHLYVKPWRYTTGCALKLDLFESFCSVIHWYLLAQSSQPCALLTNHEGRINILKFKTVLIKTLFTFKRYWQVLWDTKCFECTGHGWYSSSPMCFQCISMPFNTIIIQSLLAHRSIPFKFSILIHPLTQTHITLPPRVNISLD